MDKITFRKWKKKPLYEMSEISKQRVPVDSKVFILLAKSPKDKIDRETTVRKYGRSEWMSYFSDGSFAKTGGNFIDIINRNNISF